MGKQTTWIIHCITGKKKTFHGVLPETIEEGSMLKVRLEDGRMLIINPDNVFVTEVFTEQFDYDD